MGMFSDPAVQRLLVRCALILLGLALAVVGLWLARRARRRGRRGSAPHCFQCGYNLTGLPLPELNQRCPECGTDLSAPRAVARGRPTRHMPTLTVALLLTVIGGLTAADFAVSLWLSSWIPVKPTSWLLQDARTGSGLAAARARDTLAGRLHRGGLSTEQGNAFMEHLLELQARPRLSGRELNAVEWLGTWASKRQLSPTQRQRFLDNILAVYLAVRPTAPADIPIPVRLQTEPRTNVKFAVETEVLSFTCDGQQVVPELQRVFPTAPFSGRINRTIDLFPKPLGKHSIQAVVRVRVRTLDPQTDRFSDEVIHEMTRAAWAEFEVVAKQPEDLIQLQPDPTLTEALRSSFVLQSAYASRLSGWGPGARSAEIALLMWAQERMPVNVAFEVLGEFEGQSLFFGYVTCRAGKRPWLQELRSRTLTAVPGVLRVRLVASIDAALSAPDLEQIWDGELDLGTVSVDGAARVREWIREGQAGE